MPTRCEGGGSHLEGLYRPSGAEEPLALGVARGGYCRGLAADEGRARLVAARVGYLFTAHGGRSFAATAAFSKSSLCYVNIFLRNGNITRSNVVIEVENVNLSTARWTRFSGRTPWQMLNTERPQRESRVALPSVQCAAQAADPF